MHLAMSTPRSSSMFTHDQLRLFERRYEEGFDVYDDQDYLRWLEIHHPKALPNVRYSLASSAMDPGSRPASQDPADMSIIALFPDVLPLTEVANDVDSSLSSCPGSTTRRNNESTGPLLRSPPERPTDSAGLSKFLVLPATPCGPKKTPPKARLLTSSDAIALLEEKERKKQQEAEEKERRKKEREAKKQEREQERKRKAEERLRKAEERARKKEENARKTKEKARRTSTNSAKAGTKRKANESAGNTTFSPPQKRTCTTEKQQAEDVDTNVCCVCFTTYEEDVQEQSGQDWLACACGRWLHEDCAEDCIRDESGNDRLCPLCIDILS